MRLRKLVIFCAVSWIHMQIHAWLGAILLRMSLQTKASAFMVLMITLIPLKMYQWLHV